MENPDPSPHNPHKRLTTFWKVMASARDYWKPAHGPYEEAFLSEQFRVNRVSVRAAMFVGALVIFVRGFVDWNIGTAAAQLWMEASLRGFSALVLVYLAVALKENVSAVRGENIMSAFIIVITTTLVGTVLLNPIRGIHTLLPIVFVYLMSSALWLHARSLFWTLLISSVPILVMLAMGTLDFLDTEAYFFYPPLAILLGLILRRGRLNVAFDAFLLRKHLSTQAHMDPLTGVLNRAGWDEALASLTSLGHLTRPSSILYFDLDNFKSVNDTHGHPVGDEVLQATAASAQKLLRSQDIIARFGGEEFVVFLPGVAATAAQAIAERVRLEIQSSQHPVPVTISAGVAELSPSEKLDETIERADRALLLAKQSGRNRVIMGHE